MHIYKNISLKELDEIVKTGNMEAVDCVEGSLLDNVMYENQYFTLLANETYKNEGSSTYTVKLATKRSERDTKCIWRQWEELKDALYELYDIMNAEEVD